MIEVFEEHPELHPLWFAEKELGVSPNDKQIGILDAIACNKKVAIKACNGAGKTSFLLVPVILWWLAKFPRSKCVVTTASWAQMVSQVQGYLAKYKEKLGRDWRVTKDGIESPNGSRCIFRSTNDAGRFEGEHGTEEEPLLIIADEAKSIDQTIFQAIDRCTYQRLLLMSSTGEMFGEFFDAFDKDLGFKCFTITIDDCPHLDIEGKKREFFTKYGEGHPLTRSALYAEFMGDDELTAAAKPIKQKFLSRCYLSGAIQITRTDRAAFCDFAAGGAENVFCLREGNIFKTLEAWREKDTMSAATKSLQLFEENKLTPAQAMSS